MGLGQPPREDGTLDLGGKKYPSDLTVFSQVHRSITYNPGLYKIFDEILVNAADNKQRDNSMDTIKVVCTPFPSSSFDDGV